MSKVINVKAMNTKSLATLVGVPWPLSMQNLQGDEASCSFLAASNCTGKAQQTNKPPITTDFVPCLLLMSMKLLDNFAVR